MKNVLLFLSLFCALPTICNAQIVAYPAQNNSRTWGSQCVDLRFTDLKVIGHQNTVTVDYYVSLTDAENASNPLDRFYEPLSNPQTIYARVSSTLNSDFAVSNITISWSTSFPPPGISPCDYVLCDISNDGSEMVNLNNLKCAHNDNPMDTTFCSSDDSDIETSYYLSEDDAINEENAINSNYLITGTTVIYTKIKNIITDQSYIDGYIAIELATCTLDSDNDGIAGALEDPNKNLDIYDDDTDQDGIRNYLDNDDDGDGILTINEDYNTNGDPTDDDTNENGIPDYLESNVTLAAHNPFVNERFVVYPNPTTDVIYIQSTQPMYAVTLYNAIGQIIIVEKNTTSIHISEYSAGLYFIKLEDAFGNVVLKKLVKE